MTTAHFVAYIIFMVVSLPVIYVRPHKLQYFFYGSAATILTFEIVILIWSLATMGDSGLGGTISSGNSSNTSGWMVAFGIVSTMGSIAAGILNQNDYARFAKKPRDAIFGQCFAFPFYAISCSIIGIIVTAATQERFDGAKWNLPDLLGAIIEHGGSRSRAAAFFGGLALVVSQIGVNVPGNALSGGMYSAVSLITASDNIRIRSSRNLPPIHQHPPRSIPNRAGLRRMQPMEASKHSNYLPSRAEQLFCVPRPNGRPNDLVVFCYQPSKSQSRRFIRRKQPKYILVYIWSELASGSSGLSPFLLWSCAGQRTLTKQWVCGTTPSLPGFVSQVNPSIKVPIGLTHLYYICFLTGLAISAAVYVTLHYLFPVKSVRQFVESAPPARVLMREYRERWDEGLEFDTDIFEDRPKS